MKIRHTLLLASLLLCALPLMADDAKRLFDKATGETENPVDQAKDFCKASKLDTKNKEYQNACAFYGGSLNNSDDDDLRRAQKAFDDHEFPKAKKWAKAVSDFTPSRYEKAKQLLIEIAEAENPPKVPERVDPMPPKPSPVDPSPALYQQAQSAYEKGAFDEARTAAAGITDPKLKEQAHIILANIDKFSGLLNSAQQAEASDPAQAKKLYQEAQGMIPGSRQIPANKISELDARILAASKPPEQPPSAAKATVVAPPSPKAPDPKQQVAKMLDDASSYQRQGSKEKAQEAYAKVLAIDPSNPTALAAMQNFQQQAKTDPNFARSQLISAIQLFYDSDFGPAIRELDQYLTSPVAKNQGVAYFYRGAALLSKSALDKKSGSNVSPSTEALAAFKRAREFKYSPAKIYVSPMILKTWDSTGF